MAHHGGGVIGGGHSGGGSSQSGGGSHFGGGVVVTGGYHRRHPRSCFMGCCCGLFLLFVILVSSLFPRFSNYNLSMVSYQQQVISEDTKWKESVTVSTSDIPYINVLKFAREPPRSAVSNFNRTVPLTISGYNAYEYVMIELTRGSQFNYQWSFNPIKNVNFYFIKGDNDFNNLIASGYASNYITMQYSDHYQGGYSVLADDKYYLVFTNPQTSNANGALTYQAQLKSYDLSNPLDSCIGLSYCTFDLTLDSDEMIIVNATETPDPNRELSVSVSVSPRSSHYWTVFGIVMGVWGSLILLLVIVLTCVRRRRTATSYQPLDQTTYIVGGAPQQVQPTYGAVPPPMYGQPPMQQPAYGAAPPMYGQPPAQAYPGYQQQPPYQQPGYGYQPPMNPELNNASHM